LGVGSGVVDGAGGAFLDAGDALRASGTRPLTLPPR
jgi:hypothetical protein